MITLSDILDEQDARDLARAAPDRGRDVVEDEIEHFGIAACGDQVTYDGRGADSHDHRPSVWEGRQPLRGSAGGTVSVGNV